MIMRKMSDYAALPTSLPPPKTTTTTTTTGLQNIQLDRIPFKRVAGNSRSNTLGRRRHRSRLNRSCRMTSVAGGLKGSLLVLVTAATAAALAVLASGE